MSGTHNFNDWDAPLANIETDTEYGADALRAGGAPVDSVLPSPTFNKLARQVSVMSASLADALANKGYSCSDQSRPDLAAVLQNIMTLADMVPYAPIESPDITGTPTAPTPSAEDSSTRVATTSFVATNFASLAYAAATYATLVYLRSNYAPIVNANLSGSPTAPTRPIGDNTSGIASTNWVHSQVASWFKQSGGGGSGYILLPGNGLQNELMIQWRSGTTAEVPGGYAAGQTFTVYFDRTFSNVYLYLASPSHSGNSSDFTGMNFWLNQDNSMTVCFEAGGLHQYNIIAIGN